MDQVSKSLDFKTSKHQRSKKVHRLLTSPHSEKLAHYSSQFDHPHRTQHQLACAARNGYALAKTALARRPATEARRFEVFFFFCCLFFLFLSFLITHVGRYRRTVKSKLGRIIDHALGTSTKVEEYNVLWGIGIERAVRGHHCSTLE